MRVALTERVLLLLTVLMLIASGASAQTRPGPQSPAWADTAGESGVYPVGDAVGVYRAVLDLLYVDGKERAGVIVMYDTAARLGDGSCGTRCRDALPHKSMIDAETLRAFDSLSPKRPRLVPFGYRIPVVFVTATDFRRLEEDGKLANLGLPSASNYASNVWYGFRRKYPAAWGYVSFSKVGFNRRHTEALVQVYQRCGEICTSDEIVFLRRIGDRWKPIERIPNHNEAREILGNLRYRGPAGDMPAHSQILGMNGRAESADAAKVYRAVLDSLYSFHGESPKMIVVSDRHAHGESGLPAHTSAIDSSVVVAYNVFSQLRDGLYPHFRFRVPLVLMAADSRSSLDREGAAFKDQEVERKEFTDIAPFWLAFHARYPRAWGYVELSRVAFNPDHSQALIFTRHNCGNECSNAETWFLQRKGGKWRIGERIPRDRAANVMLDTLRYLASDADPRWYRPRRVHGVFTNALTGKTLPFLEVAASTRSVRRVIRTDAAGGYALENLPRDGEMVLKSKCPDAVPSDSMRGPWFLLHAGLDSTLSVGLDYRWCLHLNRAHPSIGAPKTSTAALNSDYPSVEAAAVYHSVLDALYPRDGHGPTRIMLDTYTRRACDYCIGSEIPRLVRKGEIDPRTELNFRQAAIESVPLHPGFPFRRGVEVLPAYEQDFLKQWSGPEFWSGMKDAYPGTEALISLSRIGFNDSHTEALVEVVVDSLGADRRPQTMLLRKFASDWRVTVSHVERESTSGEWSGGKCEPVDAPVHALARAEIEKLAGDFIIVRVGASKQFRGRTDTLRARLQRSKQSPNKPGELVAAASVIEANGEPNAKIAATFKLERDTATITFTQWVPPGMVILDGWIEWYKILRTDGHGFFGTWFTEIGPTIPLEGYFCAQRR